VTPAVRHLAGGSIAGAITGLAPPAQRALAVFLMTAVLWLTKPVPLGVSSLLGVVALVGTGAVDSFEAAAAGYASRIVFFLLLLLLLGEAIQRVGLDVHLARRLVVRPMTPRTAVVRVAGAMLLAALFMPSGLARTVTFIPVVDRLNGLFELEDNNGFLRAALLIVGQVNPIASLALMTGGGMAILSAEVIRVEVTPITWLEWAAYMLPPVVITYAMLTGVIIWTARVPAAPRIDGSALPAQSLDGEQRLVAAVMLVTIALWVVGSLTGMSTIVPPLLAVLVLSAPGVRILRSADVGRVNWNILLLFGAIMSLIGALQQTGALGAVIGALVGRGADPCGVLDGICGTGDRPAGGDHPRWCTGCRPPVVQPRGGAHRRRDDAPAVSSAHGVAGHRTLPRSRDG
jgi:di/tricarboxylate transporter